MIQTLLKQLTQEPGVLLAALVMDDGVPVIQEGGAPEGARDRALPIGSGPDALAALSAGWVNEVCQSIAGLSWERPVRLSLHGAEGTLVLRRAHTAWLAVLLGAGLREEDVLLAMDGAAARLERLVRGPLAEQAIADLGSQPASPAALPSVNASEDFSSPRPIDYESSEGR